MLHHEVQGEALTGETDGPAIEPRNQGSGMPILLHEAGAVFSSSVRTELCGGGQVVTIPTATAHTSLFQQRIYASSEPKRRYGSRPQLHELMLFLHKDGLAIGEFCTFFQVNKPL